MGAANRGQLRPHFGGRSPPFLVAALCVGLGIMGISYYSLSYQYSALESQVQSLLQKNEGLETEKENQKKQLYSREDDFDRLKISLEKKEHELTETKKQMEDRESEYKELSAKLKSLEDGMNEKNKNLIDANKELEETIQRQKTQNSEAETQLKTQIERLQKEKDELQTQLQSDLKSKSPVAASPESERKAVVDTSDVEGTNDGQLNKPNVAVVNKTPGDKSIKTDTKVDDKEFPDMSENDIDPSDTRPKINPAKEPAPDEINNNNTNNMMPVETGAEAGGTS